ncbi:MAG: MerR family transcriptional regulator [Gemmatimonadaceae bacterium]|nr:MerR family transcriptional regulator [Gemmatimonadaceae bacterium]
MTVPQPPFKVGALASATGLTVRTLHHYDEIGLLSPSERTAAGHRLYSADDVQRLQQVQSLRAVGFPLEEIRHLLASRQISAQRVITLHLEQLEVRIAEQQQLAVRLQQLARHLETETLAPVGDLCRIIEATIMMEQYFTPEQQEAIKARGAALGEQAVRNVEAEWAEVIPAVREHMARGTSPDDPDLQALARRWKSLVEAFTGGARNIAANVRRMYDEQHQTINAVHANTPDPAMFAFMGQVFAKIGGGPG